MSGGYYTVAVGSYTLSLCVSSKKIPAHADDDIRIIPVVAVPESRLLFALAGIA